MSTSDYLESLQNDLTTIKTSLNLQEGTNFTDIATMAENGEITTDGGGADLSEYFNSTIGYGTSSLPGWRKVAKKVPSPLTINTASCAYLLSGYAGTTIPSLTIQSGVTVTTCNYMFNSCRHVTEIDLSNLDLSNVTDVSYMFYYCQSATKIDIRTLDSTKITVSTQMMGNVASNCLIIVKDDEFKTWLKGKFSSLINIKTVAEYEASL